ncbi:hypothetical protein NERG_02604 [Nematocida ausubeli]|uniref:Uncharacterized protein n=1 Tax=Nematocida ausubeli (strain ATCC PRA-371 / ERTm2) TaxID=1913371 RepID=H8ZG83_NEMA1|nr:hypothetical protein NERG_02604 [Nematocida ausubeli]
MSSVFPVHTQKILYYFYFYYYSRVYRHTHSIHTCLSYKLSYTPLYSYLALLSTCLSFLHTCKYHLIFPLTDFVSCSCSPYIPGLGPSCCFCVWTLFFSYFLCFPCVCTENTLLFYYFYYLGYTAVMHTHSIHTCLSYKLAYTLSYTLLSATLALLFILLLLCAHLSISLDFPWYTLYTARVLFIYVFLGLPVFSCV